MQALPIEFISCQIYVAAVLQEAMPLITHHIICGPSIVQVVSDKKHTCNALASLQYEMHVQKNGGCADAQITCRMSRYSGWRITMLYCTCTISDVHRCSDITYYTKRSLIPSSIWLLHLSEKLKYHFPSIFISNDFQNFLKKSEMSLWHSWFKWSNFVPNITLSKIMCPENSLD